LNEIYLGTIICIRRIKRFKDDDNEDDFFDRTNLIFLGTFFFPGKWVQVTHVLFLSLSSNQSNQS